MNKIPLLFLGLFLSITLNAQNERALVRKGNKLYKKQEYVDASIKYKKAIKERSDLIEASFNLGDAYYKQKDYEQAIKQFKIAANLTKESKIKAKAYHNLGNSFLESFKKEKDPELKGQKLNQSIEAYKNALKNNPNDLDSKYNLSYALKLKSQQQKGGSKNNEQQQQDQKDKENKEQQRKEQQQQQQQEQEKQEQQQKQQQQQELSKEDAERILKQVQNQDKQVQKKLLKKKAEAVKIKIEKDW